jgi:hypothetical protein
MNGPMKYILPAVAAVTAALGVVATSSPAMAQGRCPRDQLQGWADSWKTALEEGQMTAMALGEWTSYRENFKLSSMGIFLQKPRTIDYSLTLLDTTSCRVLVETVVENEDGKQVMATQFGSALNGIGAFQNVVTGPDDWLFDADSFVGHAKDEDWGIVPEAERVSREALIAAADAYMDRFNDTSVEVPWGYPCTRIEGGAYTGKGEPTDTCEVGMPDEGGNIPVTDRLSVVDLDRQAVNVTSKFGSDEMPDSHTFRLENGVLRYVHAMTHCKGIDRCGFPAPQ